MKITDGAPTRSNCWSSIWFKLKVSGLALMLGLLFVTLHLPAPNAAANALLTKKLTVAPDAVPTADGGQLFFSHDTYQGIEGSSALVTVTRTGSSAGAVIAHIPITDVTTTARSDYLGLSDLDATFTTTANSSVAEVAIQARTDNKILIGGDFTFINDVSRPFLARLNSDGSVDNGFSPAVNDKVFGIAIQSDGKIVIGGTFTAVGETPRTRLARLNQDGSLDSSFNATSDKQIYAVAVQPDGKIVIGGLFSQVNGTNVSIIARLNQDGSLDSSFTPVVYGVVYAIRIQADGKIIIGGPFSHINGIERLYLARLNSDGSLDTSFVPNISNTIYTVGIQTDGKIIIGGVFNNVNGVLRPVIARLYPDGSNDDSFVPVVDSIVLGLDIQGDGKVVVGGAYSRVNGIQHPNISRVFGDYTVSWADGEIGSKTITVPIRSDDTPEPAETARLSLQVVQGLATIGTPPTATLHIASQLYSTTTSVTSQPNPSVIGENATFTATVTYPANNPTLSANGVVTLTLNGSFWISGTLDANGQFSVVTNTLPPGSSTIVATYGGSISPSEVLSPSQSAPYQHVVDNTICFTIIDTTDDGSGTSCGTLSYALSAAISRTAPITITFAPTVTQITLTGGLPPVPANGVIIDGGCNVQNGRGVPGVRLVAGQGASANALTLNGNATVRGLSITGFSGWALDIAGGGNRLSCNYIGTADGLTAQPNSGGVRLGANAANNMLGEAGQPASGNLISGNNGVGLEVNVGSLNNTFYYNLLGYQKDGVGELANSGGSFKLSPGGQAMFRPNNKIR